MGSELNLLGEPKVIGHMRSSLKQFSANNEEDFDFFSSEGSSGWNDKTEIDQYIRNKDVNKQLIKKLIYEANKLVPLSSVLFKYQKDWEVTENQSGWTHKSRCLFPDHRNRDNTPSFGYNSKDGRFHCFGCQRSGNTVQFLAFMEGRSVVEVAKEILFRFKSPEDVIVELEESQTEKTDELLIEFSKEVREFLHAHQDNPKALPYIESVTWSLDVYLDKHSMAGTINFESLQAMIDKLREYFDLFGK